MDTNISVTTNEETNVLNKEMTETSSKLNEPDKSSEQSEKQCENVTEVISENTSSPKDILSDGNNVHKDDESGRNDNAMETEPLESCCDSTKEPDIDYLSNKQQKHIADTALTAGNTKEINDSTTMECDKLIEHVVDNELPMVNAKDSNSSSLNILVPQTSETDSTIENESQTKESDTGDKKLDTDSNSEINTRETLEKNTVEPEKTEFVQFSHDDKQDDPQNENQCIDAEDPFGGDTLNTENVEPMETDDLSDSVTGFSKLGDQADNLQDVIKAKDSRFKATNKGDDNDKDPESTEDSRESSNVKKSTGFLNSVKDTAKDQESSDKTGNQLKDGEGEITQIEEQSDVLPGQDDELCIIPDSMKIIIPGKPAKKRNKSDSTPKKDQDTNLSIQAIEGQDNQSNTIEDKACNVNEEDTTNTTTDDPEHSQITQSSTDEPPASITTAADVEEKRKSSDIEEIITKEVCKQCNEVKSCKIRVHIGQESYNVCSKACKTTFKAANNRSMDIPSDGVNSKREKRCANCLLIIEPNDERNLSWETMEFCNEECLGKFQTKYGSYCRNCNGMVQAVSLGKYCVRFGYDVRQFCCSTCLEEFKKGLKVCSYCQKDISSSTDGFLAPVGDRGQFKDFCAQECMEKYSKINSTEPIVKEKKCCSVCQEDKITHCEVQLDRATSAVPICSEPCFAAFKFVKKVDPDQCSTCKIFFELPNKKCFVVFYENEAHTFCNKTCLNVFITLNRKIVPCNWCKVKKYNFDMIKKELKTGQVLMMCSLNCLTLYQVSVNAVSARRINCDLCKEFSQAQYHLTMSDATIRNFCGYNCVMKFQAQYTKSPITIPTGDDPVPTSGPKRTIPKASNLATQKITELQNKKNMPVISSVTSLATMANGQQSPATQQNTVNNVVMSQSTVNQNQTPQIIYKQQIITRPPSPIKVHNKITQCKPLTHTKGVSVRPHPCTKGTQTDGENQAVIPIPVPIYVPVPVHMYSMPFPVPMPFPLPIPVPIFIPTTRNSAKGILKDIKRIQEKIPSDPFEAELLMMAEMVATEKKANETDTDSGDDRDDGAVDRDNAHSGSFSPDGVDSSNTFGDDMLQMALKMATGELEEPAVDLEAALTPNTITATQTSAQSDTGIENDVQTERLIGSTRGRKRVVPYKPRSTPNKRGKRTSGATDMPLMPPPEPQPPPQPRIIEPIEKPDANMALKYTFGVNAWRQWVVTKNVELEKQSTPTRKLKLFKTELLQLTADELNYSLCLFVKEVRKPNGTEYAPDTIYYLCLGIQQYLFENNRIDNIFTDPYYEKFTDCLNEVARKFSVLYNDAQYIVTRVEEEHLWECKQLGAHSPHVLLNTLMFFNTKHFNLVSVEEHMQLSFSHIMKHWKRNPATQPTAVSGKLPGSRNVLLRFYPPQSALEGNTRKKKVYEQQENEENPLRCPVKLYEFYLSKCPESVKTRNDVFYLLPERSCVPDSPVWYSTSPLAKEHLIKMLHRIKMVKEINVALLTS